MRVGGLLSSEMLGMPLLLQSPQQAQTLASRSELCDYAVRNDLMRVEWLPTSEMLDMPLLLQSEQQALTPAMRASGAHLVTA